MMESLGSFEGKYEILEKIGQGGMGSVYKVRHRLLHEIRVIKTMRSHVMHQEEHRERFFREARIAAKARHENIAQVFDFAIDEDVAFIVMEYIDGVTLQLVFAKHGPPSLPLALEIAQQSLRALAFVHRIGVIHRDISPDNLMLAADSDGNPWIKLIDLGLAKPTAAETGLTREGFFLGKLRYASPEQFDSRGSGQVGSWSDVYSFGLVLYQLLTGRYPIKGENMAELLAGHVSHPPMSFAESDPRSRVPEDLRQIVLQALEKNPDDRFPDGEEFRNCVLAIQERYPCGPKERKESAALCRRPSKEGESAKPGSEQARLDEAFPARKSSAGQASRLAAAESGPEPAGRRIAPTLHIPVDRRNGAGKPPAAAPQRPVGDAQVAEAPEPGELTVTTPPPGLAVPPVARKRRVWLAGGVAVAAAAIAVSLLLSRIIALPGSGTDSKQAATVVEAGTLVVNALPWARVVEVTDGDGARVDLDGPEYTPLALSLPPGTYQVVLRNEAFGDRTVSADIAAGAITNELVPFAELDRDDLLRSLDLVP